MTERLRPFQIGDEVVACPKFSKALNRGLRGTVVQTFGALDLVVKWKDGITTERWRSYDLCHDTQCHECGFRTYHIVGMNCPLLPEGVQQIDRQRIDEDDSEEAK